MEIGIAGLGRMGRALAARLLEQGCKVSVWNRSRGPVDDLIQAGARGVTAPFQLWEHSAVVVSSLHDDQAALDVYLGPHGLLGETSRRKLAIDTSTILPDTVRTIARRAASLGCEIVDSPVLGTVKPARDGQLIAMVGATPEGFARARPVLDHLARRVRHVGPAGCGAAMKLAINIPMSAYWAALSDSFALADAYGLERSALIDLIKDSPAALAQLPLKIDVVTGASRDVGFSINGVVKDMQLMQRAAGADLHLPVVEGALQTYRQAVDVGVGGEDVAAVALHARSIHARTET